MTLKERVDKMQELFKKLALTTSRNEKIYQLTLYKAKDEQLSKDIDYAFEILDGRHKLGYTYIRVKHNCYLPSENATLEELLSHLYEPKRLNRFDEYFIQTACAYIPYEYMYFVDALVNRKYRLGIGQSQLEKTAISPMLGKKLEVEKLPVSKRGYYITEKLDGNRCLAKFNYATHLWEFFSRSGKQLRVAFDMQCFPNEDIFDGEIMIRSAWEGKKSQEAFNATSGIINSKYGNKSDLVYVIFDIPNYEVNYEERRARLDGYATATVSDDVVILPTIAKYDTAKELLDNLQSHLDEITSKGGEGLMVNLGDRYYEQKRTNGLLKVKEVQTMDMKVLDLLPGTGKNEGLIGALECFCKGEDGKCYSCKVGSGLSDEQRFNWAEHPEQILGKIVEVAYFSASQDAQSRGSKNYALRFPRLKRVRTDKSTTSEY